LPDPRFPEKRAVRRSFERAAATYDRHNVLQCEVGLRLLQHFDPIRIEPRRIVDVGCGTGLFFPQLRKRFPGHPPMVGVDIARPMLEKAAARTPWWRKAMRLEQPALVCADAERLPLAAGCTNLVFSNLALQWCDPGAVFAEVSRILEPGGLFIFSTFGPDTLKELRASFSAVDGYAHVNSFIDMHDLGDGLIHAGLAEPVMEMEIITLEYACVEAVARDLKAIGARNSLPGRSRGLAGRGRWRDVIAHYEKYRRDGALPATYEVVYGHAWKTTPKKIADGRQVIEFRPRAAR
jgi:malonyl-CoA O-methyltransferase